MSKIRPLADRIKASKKKTRRLEIQDRIKKLKKEAKDLRREEL